MNSIIRTIAISAGVVLLILLAAFIGAEMGFEPQTDEMDTSPKEHFLQMMKELRETAEHGWSRQAKTTAQAALILDLRLAHIEAILLSQLKKKGRHSGMLLDLSEYIP